MKILKIRNVKTPNRGTPLSAGIDFYVPEKDDFYYKKQIAGTNGTVNNNLSEPIKPGDGKFYLPPGKSVLIPAGIKTQFSKDYALIAFNKSGVAAKNSLIVGACVIDADYQGEIHLDIKNVGNKEVVINAGDKIAQFILVNIGLENIEEVETEDQLWANKSQRGAGGFGSTNQKN